MFAKPSDLLASLNLRLQHGLGWVHCDIKTENVLIVDRDLTIKVADFGVCKKIDTGSELGIVKTLGGTPSCLFQWPLILPFFSVKDMADLCFAAYRRRTRGSGREE